MEFRTQLKVKDFQEKISHGDKIISLGSCFSENIGQKLIYFGWGVNNNPFGTVYHPLAIANLLKKSINQDETIRICQKEGAFYTFETHSRIFGKSAIELQHKFKQKLLELRQQLQQCNWLVVTFGSAWGYFLEREIVANCHKQKQTLFTKKLSEIEVMKAVWSDLIKQIATCFPQIKIIFTVSPVRHIKDGMIENQLSKARLIELVHSLNGNYFPAYEILMDDLRDYRFYKKDLLHPSDVAIEYVFEQFTKVAIETKSATLFKAIDTLRKAEQHRFLIEKSQESIAFKKQIEGKKVAFFNKNPKLIW